MTVPVQAGGYVLGIRTSSVDFGDILRQVFAERFVPDADPPANLSAYIAPKALDGPQPYHRLHEGYRIIQRSRSGRQILDGLGRRLAAWDERAHPDRIVLEGVVLLHGGLAHLLPSSARQLATRLARQWAEAGLVVADDSWVVLDAEAGTVTLPSAPVCTSAEIERLLAGIDDGQGDGAQPPEESWPIASWSAGDERLSLAGRVVVAARQILDRTEHDAVGLVSRMATLLEPLPTLPHDWATHEELPRLLTGVDPPSAGTPQ